MLPEQWVLIKGRSMVLGSLTLQGIDQPWLLCKFEPTESFAKFRSLFEEEVRLSEDQSSTELWRLSQETIDNLCLKLRSIESRKSISEFIIHINGDEAWFRS